MADTLKPIHPAAALRDLYARRLKRFIDAMHRDVTRSVEADWRTLARDASPANEAKQTLRKKARLWRTQFNQLSKELAQYFATKSINRVDSTLQTALRKRGFTVQFKMTPDMKNVLQATMAEQVNLISSIPDEYFTKVESSVMRSMQLGGDVGGLSKELRETLGITKRRADFIARDQTSKATATMTRTRHLELGITQARWQHSAGGKHPRPEHVAFSGKIYDIEKGAFLEGKWTFPGVEINCRCVSIPILPELG